MEKHLIEQVDLSNAEIYYSSKGRRFLLTECKARLDVYEDRIRIPTIGGFGGVKKRKYVLSICSELAAKREIDFDFLRKVESFEIYADICREDGVFERLKFTSLSVVDIEIDGEWVFEVLNTDRLKDLNVV